MKIVILIVSIPLAKNFLFSISFILFAFLIANIETVSASMASQLQIPIFDFSLIKIVT